MADGATRVMRKIRLRSSWVSAASAAAVPWRLRRPPARAQGERKQRSGERLEVAIWMLMLYLISDMQMERCSDGVEDQGAEEASWAQRGEVTSVLEAVSRGSGSPSVRPGAHALPSEPL
jgi:hypothetical protein